MAARVLALFVLARSLIKVTLVRLFGKRKAGLALFHENYDADRLPSVEPDEREQLSRFSRCIACGRCDMGEAERMAKSQGAYPGLMTVVLASTRNMPDFDAAAIALSHVPDPVLAQKECPVNVPFVELARFVRNKAQSMQRGEGPALHR